MATRRGVARALAASATLTGIVFLNAGPASADDGLLKIVQEATGTVQNSAADATGVVQNAERDAVGTVQNIAFDVTGTLRAILCPTCA